MDLMSPSSPGAGRMSGPPMPPPDTPSLSAYPAGGGGSPSPNQTGAMPRLFFEAEKSLDVIAASAPEVSKDIDRLKSDLRDILTRVLQGGAARPKPSLDQEGLPPSGR